MTKAFYKKQGSVTALDDINLTIEDGEFVCLVGPSGCGKTTLLRILAGLEQPSIGEFTIKTGGEERPLQSMVFQERGIIPWLTVEENVAFGLKMRHMPKDNRKRADGLLFKENWTREVFLSLSERVVGGDEATCEYRAGICQ